MLDDDNAWTYWSRSDAFTMALNLGANPRSREGLARAIEACVAPSPRVAGGGRADRAASRTGLALVRRARRRGDARSATRCGAGETLDPERAARVLALFRMTLPDDGRWRARAGHPVYLILAMTSDGWCGSSRRTWSPACRRRRRAGGLSTDARPSRSASSCTRRLVGPMGQPRLMPVAVLPDAPARPRLDAAWPARRGRELLRRRGRAVGLFAGDRALPRQPRLGPALDLGRAAAGRRTEVEIAPSPSIPTRARRWPRASATSSRRSAMPAAVQARVAAFFDARSTSSAASSSEGGSPDRRGTRPPRR